MTLVFDPSETELDFRIETKIKELYPDIKINDNFFNPAQVQKVISFQINTGVEIDLAIEKLNIKNIKQNKKEFLKLIDA